MAWSAINCNAQQITMKAGAALGKVDSREIGGEIHRMLNVYWETNYALRIATFRFVTFGLSYLGTGGKFSDTYVPTYYNYDYHNYDRAGGYDAGYYPHKSGIAFFFVLILLFFRFGFSLRFRFSFCVRYLFRFGLGFRFRFCYLFYFAV